MDIQKTGFVPGKGRAHDYVPPWMNLPALYTTEKAADPLAVIKLFTPDSSWTWYLTEYDGEALAFGLVVGFETELGCVSLRELRGVKGKLGLRVERDLWFRPTPITQLPEYIEKWGAHGPYKGGRAEKMETPPLQDGWKAEDVRFLLEKLAGGPLLVADSRLGIPSIHDWKGAEHLGFGLFRVEVENATLHFEAGGAMAHTPSGKGWCRLQIEGRYAFDFGAVREILTAFLNDDPSGDIQGKAPTPEIQDPSPAQSGPLQVQAKAGIGTVEGERSGRDLVAPDSRLINDSASIWTPSPNDLQEFQLLEDGLLQGDLGRGGDGYLALLAAKLPGTLKLALQEVVDDPIRKRLTENRLQEILQG